MDVQVSFDFKPYVRELYGCTLTCLKAADIDQEVKEKAISCIYGLWRTMTSLHWMVEFSLMEAGHTKFNPDWHFEVQMETLCRRNPVPDC